MNPDPDPIYIIFQDKKAKRSHKTLGMKVFLTIFAWWYKDPGGPKTYGSDWYGSATLVQSTIGAHQGVDLTVVFESPKGVALLTHVAIVCYECQASILHYSL